MNVQLYDTDCLPIGHVWSSGWVLGWETESCGFEPCYNQHVESCYGQHVVSLSKALFHNYYSQRRCINGYHPCTLIIGPQTNHTLNWNVRCLCYLERCTSFVISLDEICWNVWWFYVMFCLNSTQLLDVFLTYEYLPFSAVLNCYFTKVISLQNLWNFMMNCLPTKCKSS